jgi:glycosyltransferase involved in cell wall biosynthesis
VERKKKVYFIACCFPPIGRGNSITNSCVVNYLAERFDVEVVCMEREDGGLISYQEDNSLTNRLHGSLKVHRVRGLNWYGLNIWLYAVGLLPCYYLNWAYGVWRKRKDLFPERGVIFAVYPVFSDLVVGVLLSRWRKWPMLVDFRDDFSGVMTRGWRRIYRPFYRYLEKYILNMADQITVTTETLAEDLIARYELPPDKVTTVYNIVPESPIVATEQSEASMGLSVIYAGAISRVQKPEILFKAHAMLCDSDSTWEQRLNVEMYGPESLYFSLRVRQHLGPGRRFGGFLPQEEMALRVARADIGFFSLCDNTYGYATPTKLFDYIEAGVPIVASLPEGASKDLIESNGIGIVAAAGDVAALASVLAEMAGDSGLRARCRRNMARIKQRFNPRRQVDKWSALLEVMANASG